MIRLSLFFALLFALPLIGDAQKIAGSRYKLRDTFLRFSGPNCYEITRDEGLRALKARDWDLAASLFRSAKNCTDANEKRRAEMSTLIGESQTKAKNELIEKEREATRIARHAIASNRAEDAQELLRSFNRSLAFRLADFADRFIAPPDDNQNSDCVQALLDAWNYSPYYHSNTSNYPNVQLPFCFQVVENLGPNAQIKYANYQGKSHLFAFSPVETTDGNNGKQEANKAAMLYWWDAETLERRGSMRLDKDLTGFDVAPDGRTLVFFSKRQFVFWRGPGENMTLDVPNVDLYCFDDDCQKFYYFLPERGEIYLKNVPKSFSRITKNSTKRSKGNYASTPLKEETEPVYSGIAGAGFFKFSVRKGALWMAYYDRVMVMDHGVGKTFPMPYSLYPDTKPDQVMLWPEVRRLQFTNDSLDIMYLLPMAKSPDGTKVEQMVGYGELPLASDPTGSRLLASYNPQTSHVYIRENARDIRYYSTPSLRQDDGFKLNGASLSPDGQWLAAITREGMLMAYSLGNELHNSSWPFFPTRDFSLQFTPDGHRFVVLQDDSIRVFDADDWHNPQFAFKPEKEAPVLVLTDNMLAYRASQEALQVFRFSDGKQFEVNFPVPFGYVGHIVDLDSVHNRIVHASGRTVTIEQLGGNNMRWSREFEGRVQSVYFVPQSQKLMVIHESSGYNTERSSIKFWSYEQPSASIETLRTSDFKEGLVSFSPNAQLVALANEQKIWIYNLKDLSEEQAFIYRVKSNITAITFSPDDKAIVVGFESGDIKGYDVSNGNVIYKIPPISNDDMPVLGLYFYDDGKRLRQVLGINVERQIAGPRNNYNSTNTFVSRQMDTKGFSPQLISGDRQLVSFSAEQIRSYDLESALDFGDNFRMLAESGDLPLIRSFFDYYLNEAKQSNNSELVRTYCDRAFDLYARLDPESQRVLQADMVNMNEDLIWKLLLRGKTREAGAAILKANTNLDKPSSLFRYSGHAALLRGELQNASRYYTDWLIYIAEKAGLEGGIYGFEILNQDFLELNEYGLINGRQNQFLCSLFGANNASINDFLVCDSSKILPVNQLMDALNAQRWNILNTMMGSKEKLNLGARKRELLDLWPEAQKLTRTKPAQHSLFEMLAIEITQTCKEEGDKAQDAQLSIKAYTEALETLKRAGNFQQLHIEGSVAKQAIYLDLANKQLSLGQYTEAKNNYHTALDIIQNLKGASADNFDWASSMGSVYANLGMIHLYENKIAEAETLFARADSTNPGGLNKLYFAHAALLRGDRDEALLGYGDIYDSRILADALFEIERFADRYPEKQQQLKEMSQTLLKLLPQQRPDAISATETKYWFAERQMRHFSDLHKWRDARLWVLEMVGQADEMLKQEHGDALNFWVDAYVSASYYYLFESNENPSFLDESIHFAQIAMDKTKDVETKNYSIILLETNLAHALYLRNKPGDKEEAVKHYRHYLEQQIQVYEYDLWETLMLDFIYLHDKGIRFSDLRGLVGKIKPDAKISESEWKNMGG